MATKNIWTKAELEKLRDLWDGHTIDELATLIKKSKKAVVQMAFLVRQKYPKALESKRTSSSALIQEVFGR